MSAFACTACGEGFGEYKPTCPICKRGAVCRVQPAAVEGFGASAERPRRAAEYLRRDVPPVRRASTGLRSVDEALGGGVAVEAAAVYLLGGFAGCGKSTMAFLWADRIPGAMYFALLSEGDRTRWDEIGARTGLAAHVPFFFLEDEREIVETVEAERPKLVIVDQLHAFEGSEGREKEILLSFVAAAQSTRATFLVLAEREKASGTIRGAGSLEHKVEGVLLLERRGDVGSSPPNATAGRWLRVKKNRLGRDDLHPELVLTERGWSEPPPPTIPAP